MAFALMADMTALGVFPARQPARPMWTIAGTVTFKMAERIKGLYEQMPEPKYVILWVPAPIAGPLLGAYDAGKGVDRVAKAYL